MSKRSRYSPEVRERAVRMVFDHQAEYESQWAAMSSIAANVELRARLIQIGVFAFPISSHAFL